MKTNTSGSRFVLVLWALQLLLLVDGAAAADSSSTSTAVEDRRSTKNDANRRLRSKRRTERRRRLQQGQGTGKTSQDNPYASMIPPRERNDDEDDEVSHLDEQQLYERQRQRRVDAVFHEHGENEAVRALVGYKTELGRTRIEELLLQQNGGSVDVEETMFPEISVVAVNLTKATLRILQQDSDNIDYIEKDSPVYMLADPPLTDSSEAVVGETVPWGVEMALAGGGIPQPPSGAGFGNCASENAFKVAVIDSGTSRHPDLKCNHATVGTGGCIGRSFGTSAKWNQDLVVGHGTKVLGIINALGDDQSGIRGMVKDRKLCLLIGRVFGDNGHTDMSIVMNAVRWAAKQGASVINLSLGGPDFNISWQNFYRDIAFNQGKIVVAAVGNEGISRMLYPAGFSGVVGISAVDKNGDHAKFSNTNIRVDFAAPGLGIQTTAPGGGYSTSHGTSVAAPHMTGAIALVWRVCRDKCTSFQVLKCFQDTAIKKGTLTADADGNMKSIEYGNGIIQTRPAYLCMKNSCCR